jgi:hypothetical protein
MNEQEVALSFGCKETYNIIAFRLRNPVNKSCHRGEFGEDGGGFHDGLYGCGGGCVGVFEQGSF